MKATKIYNATVYTSWYGSRGQKVGRNRRVKVEAAKDISYNELENLVYDECQRLHLYFEYVLWYN
jgi:autotransporter adhesin